MFLALLKSVFRTFWQTKKEFANTGGEKMTTANNPTDCRQLPMDFPTV